MAILLSYSGSNLQIRLENSSKYDMIKYMLRIIWRHLEEDMKLSGRDLLSEIL